MVCGDPDLLPDLILRDAREFSAGFGIEALVRLAEDVADDESSPLSVEASRLLARRKTPPPRSARTVGGRVGPAAGLLNRPGTATATARRPIPAKA